ncbi:MAG: tRNA-dihydrouridine synthase family protein [Candidatus Woesearchaeota archaeon]
MTELGRLKIDKPYLLAPMSMYSDIGLRKICQRYGAGYAFTEQIYTSEFIKLDEALKQKLDLFDEVGLQFISNSPTELKESLRIINDNEFYPGLKNVKSIDLNLGCPTKEVISKNLGAALLNQPELVRSLFKTMKENTDLPVSAKFRLALDAKHKKSKPYLRIAKIAQEEGLDFITIHGRSAGQGYTGEVDLEAIKEVHEQIKIPLIANGNIVDEESAEKMLKISDAVMIGQQAIQDPFIFKQLDQYFSKHERWEFDLLKEKRYCIKKYLNHAFQYGIGFQHIKIHLQGFLKGMEGREQLIRRLTHTKTIGEINELMAKGFS